MANNWKPPRGIRVCRIGNRASPFAVYWRFEGTRQSKFFKTESDQLRFAKKLASEKDRHGVTALAWNSKDFEEWKLFKDLLGDVPVKDLLDCWTRFGQDSGGEFIQDLIPKFLMEKEAKGVSNDSMTAYKNHLARFGEYFSGRRMDAVKSEDIWHWLQSLNFESVTRANHRKSVRTFYNWANIRGYARTNPAKAVEDDKTNKDIEILTIEEGKQFFAANRNSVAVGRFALEAFGMLRYSSAKRLRLDHINWQDCGITLPAARLKTRKRKYVDGHPDNLWQWLRHASPDCWQLTERQYQEEKVRAFDRAGVPHPHNCFRHSACTYHYAAYKDPGLTASLMAHTNLQTMEQFYRGRATHADGLRWFEISPDRVDPLPSRQMAG